MPDAEETAQPDNSGGSMLALYPSPELADALAVPDGLPPEEIHCTIVYAGAAADVDRKALKAVARRLARRPPVEASISGHARFTGGKTDVIVALADGSALEDLRRDAMDALSALGVDVPRDHGYTPHLSLLYADPGDPDPVGRLDSAPLCFAGISVVHGKKRTDYPFPDPVGDAAREAYTAGWALSGGPVTERFTAGREAAAAHARQHRGDPSVLEVSLDLGSLEGTWAEVYRRREELTAKHVKAIAAGWRKLVKRLGPGDLIAAYRRETILGEADGDAKPTQKQKDAAKAALLLWLRNILHDPEYKDLADAITTAMAEATAEGKTSALAVAAEQAGKAGFDWQKAYDAMRAAVTAAQTQGAADTVTQDIIRAVAADAGRILAKLDADGASDTEIAKALEDEIAAGVGAAELAVDTAASGYWGQGQIALAADEGILLDWLTAGDGGVCGPICQYNEDNGPYEPSVFPDFPGHTRCRCTPTPALPLRFTAFAAFLVPPG